MCRMFTLGHSTRILEEFLALLREHEIEQLVDVRRFPSSRRYPHFAQDALAGALHEWGIDYRHEPDMGGYRKPRPDSPNTAWRSAGFRAYADHMDTPEFQGALRHVIALAEKRATAIMCAEATPFRCHRQLIADALVARGVEVLHILGPGKTVRHEFNPNARVVSENRLVYPEPAPPPSQTGLFDSG